MKKFILSFILFTLTFTPIVSANTGSTSSEHKVYITAPIPGPKCTAVIREGDKITPIVVETRPVWEREYECVVPQGISAFQLLFGSIVRWILLVASLLGVLAIAALGIAHAVAGGEDTEAKKFLKEWFINLIIGFAILFFFQAILYMAAPWIYQ